MKNEKLRKTLSGFLGTISAVLLWHLASRFVGSSLILPGPVEVVSELFKLAGESKFWMAVLGSSLRVLKAFALSMSVGSILGIASAILPRIDDFLAPLLTTIRATPVLALILVAMFWFRVSDVPIFSAFLMAFPIAHTSARSGIRNVDPNLLEMAKVFKVPQRILLFRLRIPSAASHFASAAKNSLGICWKVVVAGEVLSQPLNSLGGALQDKRLSLETPGVFAWVMVTIFLCGISEYLLGLVSSRASRIAAVC